MADNVQIDLVLLTKQYERQLAKASKQAEGFQKSVTGDMKGINSSLKGLTGQTKKTGDALSKSFGKGSIAIGSFIGNLAAISFTAVINGAKRLTTSIIDFGIAASLAASDSEETFSKFATVFQEVGKEAQSVATNLSKAYGLGITESKDLLSATGDLLSGFGFAGKESLSLSKRVQELSVDLSSFTNFSGGAAGASAALTKALLGERESVKALGISILEKDVVQQVAINKANGMTFATNRQARAQATLDIAISQSKNAIGDYAKTSGSVANQLKLLATQFVDLKIAVGSGLTPAIGAAIRPLTQFIANIDPKVITKFVAEGVIVLTNSLIDLVKYINPVIAGFRIFGNVAQIQFALVVGYVKNTISILGGLYEAGKIAFEGIKNSAISAGQSLVSAFNFVKGGVNSVITEIGSIASVMASVATSFVNSITRIGTAIIEKLIPDVILDKIKTMSTFIGGAFDFIVQAASGAFNRLITTATSAVKAILSTFKGVGASILKSIVPSFLTKGVGAIGGIFNKVSLEVASDTNTMKESVTKDYQDMKDALDGTVSEDSINKIKDGLTSIKTATKDSLKETVDVVKTAEQLKAEASIKAIADEKARKDAASVAGLNSLKASQGAQLLALTEFEQQKAELLATFKEQSNLVQEEAKVLDLEGEQLDKENALIARAEFEQQKIDATLDAELRKAALIKDKRKSELAAEKAQNTALLAGTKNKLDSERKLRKNADELEKGRRAGYLTATSNFLSAGAALAKQGSAAQKAIMLSQAVISTYTAANQAMTTVPYPANFAAAASTIAVGLANVAKITSAGSFANGGVVGGSSFNGDNLTANVNSGEMILNRQQQTRLFEQSNTSGGSVGGDTAAAITALGEKIAQMEIVLKADDIEIARSTSRGVSEGIVIGVSE